MFIVSTQLCYTQEYKSPLSSSEVYSRLESKLESSQDIIQWKEVDKHLLWSTLNVHDKMVSIGYKPAGEIDIRSQIRAGNTGGTKWNEAREKIISYVISESRRKYGSQITRESLIPKGRQNELPYINIKVLDREIMEHIMAMPEVSYFEPKSTPDFSKRLKSDSGCSSGVNNVNSNDYTPISPQSIQSWHHDAANIPCAWMNSNHGDGIWIAVLDTGISSDQDKLNSEFAEGQSTGRFVEKYNTYQTNGVSTSNWEDQCGHGTSMTGLATAPRGFNNMPAGVAYKANLISYRCTEDVLLNRGDEKDGVTEALIHAANDPRVNIISMSIGDVFSSSQIQLAVEYAYDQGKLIFAAAGTSTSFTNWYPVIFPAWLPETVAVTGIIDGGSRQRCNTCHDGLEVDFVVRMQRASDSDRNAVTLAMPDNADGYVSGSSAATATMAGIAGLVWGNNPTWTKDDVLTRLTQTADNYPSRDNDFGWGAVDVCKAVDSNFGLVCSSGVINSVEMAITNINFRAESDTGGEAEWVITINGDKFFFDVSVNGASGNPANFHNSGECGTMPMVFDLGMTSCNQSTIPVTVAIHEDDGITSDCDLDGGDENYGSSTEIVSFANNSFSYNGIVFTYQLLCTSNSTPPAAGLSVPQDTCLNSIVDVEFFASGGTGPYTVTYSENGGATQSLILNPNAGSIPANTSTTGSMIYTLLSVTDANGCGQTLSQSETVTIHPIPTIAASAVDPSTCGGIDGQILVTVTNVPDGNYDITYSGGVFTAISVSAGSAVITGLAQGNYDDLLILANTCASTELPDVVLIDPIPIAITVGSDAPQCPGTLTTIEVMPIGMQSYTFFLDTNNNGFMDGGEQVQTGPSHLYGSTNFVSGDIVGVTVIDSNNCSSTYFTVVMTLPVDYAFAGSGGLIGVEIGVADYETDGILESTQTIDFSAIVDYDSAIEVNLLGGFETILGAQFEAFIDGCNGGLGGQN